MLLKHIGLSAAECVSVGDGNNDVDILRTAGLSFCVEGGESEALAAAVCRMIWPEALDGIG